MGDVDTIRQSAPNREEPEPELRKPGNLARKRVLPQKERRSQPKKSGLSGTEPSETTSPAIVLILDDDPSVRRSLRVLISASGFEVETFATPTELLASAISSSNACMVVDIGLPEMSGIEMCQGLKRSGRARPTILISGGTDLIALALAQQSDAVAVLLKPFDEAPLLAAIERALALSIRSRS
jgi:FixJ family two-component response regulator